ncbi:MAG TPA: zinc metalloprotease HtpX [Actinomycetota bacterium]
MTPGINRAKTWILIAGLMGLFLLVGRWIGGTQGMTIALIFGLGFNAAMYWFSGSIAVRTTRSRLVIEQEAPALHRIVRELAQEQGLPMPEVYVSDMLQPNAFATGRNPANAKVAVTKGILQILDERELRGVLAHELSHVANRDILISSIAAGIGTAISYLAQFALFFGGDDDEGANPLFLLLAWIVAPMAAAVIQMAVSRSREFQADETGAYLSRDPDALASALRKLDLAARQVPPPQSLSPAEAHLFIVNPLAALRGRGISSLFSTHPPTEERVARLEAIGLELRGGSPIGG